MKHNEILKKLVAEAESDANILGFLVFGSVATGTQREDSDIDVISVLQTNKPTSGLNNTLIDGIKVGNIFFTYDILVHSVETVPYLLHPLGGAHLLCVEKVSLFISRISRSFWMFIGNGSIRRVNFVE